MCLIFSLDISTFKPLVFGCPLFCGQAAACQQGESEGVCLAPSSLGVGMSRGMLPHLDKHATSPAKVLSAKLFPLSFIYPFIHYADNFWDETIKASGCHPAAL